LSPSAAILLENLPGVLGLPAENAVEAVGELIAEGYAQIWTQAPGGPSLTLTAISVAIHGVEIGHDRSRNGYTGRWAPRVRGIGPCARLPP
jgi:hypothetical protein